MNSRTTNSHKDASSSGSLNLEAEREAIRKFADRKSRAILAIIHARRCARKEEFFVSPQIAKFNDLSPSDLNWALDKLEGEFVETTKQKKGKWRMIRLLPQFLSPPSQIHRSGQHPDDQIANGGEKVVIDYETTLSSACAEREKENIETNSLLKKIAQNMDERPLASNTRRPPDVF